MNPNHILVLKDTANGKGVFAGKDFRESEKIIDFTGKVLDYDEIEKDSYIDNHCLQIGERTYLGPFGGLDDFFNHSCDPNSGLKEVGENKIALFAIKNIKIGEEITWDYSTYIKELDYFIDCVCGSKICRNKVGSFNLLAKSLREKYKKLDVVAHFILKNDN